MYLCGFVFALIPGWNGRVFDESVVAGRRSIYPPVRFLLAATRGQFSNNFIIFSTIQYFEFVKYALSWLQHVDNDQITSSSKEKSFTLVQQIVFSTFLKKKKLQLKKILLVKVCKPLSQKHSSECNRWKWHVLLFSFSNSGNRLCNSIICDNTTHCST